MCAGDAIAAEPCILALDATLQLDMDGVTLSVHNAQDAVATTAKANASNNYEADFVSPALLLPGRRQPLHAMLSDERAAEIASEIHEAERNTGAPAACGAMPPSWSAGNVSSVVLSCVSFDEGDFGFEVNVPLGTAMNITGVCLSSCRHSPCGCLMQSAKQRLFCIQCRCIHVATARAVRACSMRNNA